MGFVARKGLRVAGSDLRENGEREDGENADQCGSTNRTKPSCPAANPLLHVRHSPTLRVSSQGY